MPYAARLNAQSPPPSDMRHKSRTFGTARRLSFARLVRWTSAFDSTGCRNIVGPPLMSAPRGKPPHAPICGDYVPPEYFDSAQINRANGLPYQSTSNRRQLTHLRRSYPQKVESRSPIVFNALPNWLFLMPQPSAVGWRADIRTAAVR